MGMVRIPSMLALLPSVRPPSGVLALLRPACLSRQHGRGADALTHAGVGTPPVGARRPGMRPQARRREARATNGAPKTTA